MQTQSDEIRENTARARLDAQSAEANSSTRATERPTRAETGRSAITTDERVDDGRGFNVDANTEGGREGMEISDSGPAPDPTTPTPPNDVTGEIPNDPGQEPDDGGSYETDKIKLQDGDIIDYLFKEWLLEGLAWCLNEAGSLAGAIVYETARPLGHSLHKGYHWTRDRVTEHLSNIYHNRINPNHNNANDIRTGYTAATTELRNTLDAANVAQTEDLALIRQDIGSRRVIMENGHLVDTQDPTRRLPNISEESFNDVRNKADKFHLDIMRSILSINDGNNNDNNALQTYYNEKANNPNAVAPNSKYEAAFNRARDVYTRTGHKLKERVSVLILHTQAQLFAEHYSQYQIEEDKRKHPDKAIYNKERRGKKLDGIKRDNYLKAYDMFMRIQKARRTNDTIPSNETLIDMAKHQCNEASAGHTVEDKIKTGVYDRLNLKNVQPETLNDTFESHNATLELLRKELDALGREGAENEIRAEQANRLRTRIAELYGIHRPDSETARQAPETQQSSQIPTQERLEQAAAQRNGVLWPNQYHNYDTMQAMLGIGMISTNSDGQTVLTNSQKLLLENGADSLISYPIETFGPIDQAKEKAKKEHLQYMSSYMNDQNLAADSKVLSESYDHYNKSDYVSDTEKKSPEYQAFIQARETFKNKHNIPSNKEINKIIQNSSPKHQTSKPNSRTGA